MGQGYPSGIRLIYACISLIIFFILYKKIIDWIDSNPSTLFSCFYKRLYISLLITLGSLLAITLLSSY